MSVTLQQMTPQQFSSYTERSKRVYAEGMFDEGEYNTYEEAYRAAVNEVVSFYSSFNPRESYHGFNIFSTTENAIVGILVISFLEHRQKSQLVAFVDYIEVLAPYRRKGYAKDAMIAVEAFVTEHNLSIIDLNVMRHKKGARKLYQGLGYEKVRVKRLGPTQAVTRFDMRKELN